MSIAARRFIRRTGRQVLLQSLLAGRRTSADRPPPDFIIVGAQRCGTTSLFRALSMHRAMMPNILNAKGVHYFDTSYDKGLAWYLAHFATRKERDLLAEQLEQNTIVGEASPYYLYHPAVAERMAKAVPDAKLVVLLRDPVKRAISHHLHMVWEGHEPETDIDKALDMEHERLKGIEQRLLADPTLVSREHQHFSYASRGHYADQLERLYRYYDRSNVLVMASETLFRNSKAALAEIQSFVGLEPDSGIDLEQRNASSKTRPGQQTIDRLTNEYTESNQRLRSLVDADLPWIQNA